eukprot:CAMPEP_0113846348 /NCGR_PEP_ID=MMETSP0372-20130328/1259_1 /TAXON_ID=340204 /ORGANISM="Lankesteria abbotti" /LENGTH=262 /DNA_ID=CAMNT_0000815485 /DNA_START=52 /DNA_END=840 /DNA_ORIENTATION=- /assembly_acc=CAM_ASM_000359
MNLDDLFAEGGVGGCGDDSSVDFLTAFGDGTQSQEFLDSSQTSSTKEDGSLLSSSAQADLLATQCQSSLSSGDADFMTAIEPPVPVLQNIIASVNLMVELDLRKIAISARNAEYNPRKVNAAVVRVREPKCTGLVFRNGKMMITGAKAPEDAKRGGKKVAKLCQKAGHPGVRFHGFHVENLIATATCNFPVRLEGLANVHQEFCSYETELFPGLIYRLSLDNCKAVLLIFSSGKVIITGCKSTQQVEEAFNIVFPVLALFRK